MYIRKRNFLEMTFPFLVVSFVCLGTSFVAEAGGAKLRWIFDIALFLYLLVNKKILTYINPTWMMLVFFYFTWCISTTLWSEIPILSFSKSALFSFDAIVMLSAGSLWVVKYGYIRSMDWLLFVLLVMLISGFSGGASAGSFDNFGSFRAYSALDWNPNDFGFLTAIVTPFIFLKLYQYKKDRLIFLAWFAVLLADFHFLCATYARSCMAIFLCVFSFFIVSLSLSKKILITFSFFACLAIFLVMMPVSYLENVIAFHILKPGSVVIDPKSSELLQTRSLVWKESLHQAMKGGFMGGGFSVTIGDKDFSMKELSGYGYGREKGNAPLAVMEETGFIGFALSALVLIFFFIYAIPHYLRLKDLDRVAMGLTLGAITGLIMESLVEAWWDSAAGPELICFWTFVGCAYGMVYLRKKKLQLEFANKNNIATQ